MDEDVGHLKLLSIFHYVVGGIAAFFACFPIIHLIIGIGMLAGGFEQASSNGHFPAFLFGLMFVLIPGFIMLCGWALAICLIIAGRQLAERKHYTFCLVTACISCIFMPFGTVLGVFTIIVLMRPSVKELFAANQSVSPVR
ncbi:MAG: hypothetical protein ACYSUC_05245 [Planctomycetota bacterium]|jgi:hypothetical protein